jgi:hypothetical protein
MGEKLVVLGRERMKNISSAWIAKKAKQIQPAVFDRPVPTDCVAGVAGGAPDRKAVGAVRSGGHGAGGGGYVKPIGLPETPRES